MILRRIGAVLAASYRSVYGVLASTAGAVATWNAGPAYDPKWYPLALVALAVPSAWAGGRLVRPAR